MNIRLMILLAGVSAVLALSGCGSASSVGIAVAPFIPESQAVFTDAEKVRLVELSKSDPVLFQKLQALNNEKAAGIAAHNKFAMSQRMKMWKALEYSDEECEILRLELVRHYRLISQAPVKDKPDK